MYSWEKPLKKDRFQQERKNPSFSSTLLDEIYRSIDEGGMERGHFNSYRDTVRKKQSNCTVKSNRAIAKEEEEEMGSLQQACLIEKWMQKKASEKAVERRRQSLPEWDRKSLCDNNDALFFSTTSSSSDSSSGGFSSSETESIYATKTRTSCFGPSRPKPVRTSVSAKSEKSEKSERTERPLFYEQRELHMFDGYHYNSVTEHGTKHEEGFIKSKSRALKIYSNLKKVKQPLSPGGRLATFLNSLFTAGNSKKTKTNPSNGGPEDADMERKSKSTQASTCSSASSFSRSCLSKNSPASREKLRNGVKRSVRFYPVSVIVDEDCRPCGHKSLYEEDPSPRTAPISRKSMNSPTRRSEKELKFQLMEKSRRVEEAAREFLKGYHQNQRRNGFIMSHLGENEVEDEEEDDDDDDDDDAASYSSSDLFELDHLAFIGNNRYCEELPVYETTHVDTNRAIANGLIL
ncbi:hypothetical protein L1049_018924 [Liquidambar formosana]|uniref:Protein BIG GRAIN 1-like A n=1 Tax=Liquidambar formosana TaxID=63359 RepID=A0AAP0RAS0_LIQFO